MEISVAESLSRARLYGILDLSYVEPLRVLEIAELMLEGGVEVLQLRAKRHGPEMILTVAQKLAPLCRQKGVPFILNDYPELVSASGADGVHVGQDDLSVAEARRRAGPAALVGKSTHSFEQAVQASAEGADYIGFGPLFATPTKPDYIPIGMEDIARVHAAVSVPIFCIGGIKRENISRVTAAGARRLVIVSGILQADDVPAYCRDCLSLLPGDFAA